MNFATRMLEAVDSAFTNESLVAGKLTTDYNFSGAKTIKVMTPLTVPMNDYDRAAVTNRYGTPSEMQDLEQEMVVAQDKSFSLTIDKGNFDDQAFLKKASAMLMLQVQERAIPEMDAYIFKALANKAGTVVAAATAPTRATICGLISEGTQHLDDAEVPQNDRTLFVSTGVYALLKHSDEYMQINDVGRDALRRGEVGTYDNMTVVKVPAKRWPAGVNFIIAHKSAAVAPVKLSDTQIHENPPGLSGSLIEGRNYYDLFVFAAKCSGVYVHVDASDGCGICATPVINKTSGAITCATSGAIIKFTTDGSDPRYSSKAKTGTQSDITAAGTEIRAYAFKDQEGLYPSGVAVAIKA